MSPIDRPARADQVILRPLETGDVGFAAGLHRTALPHGFFVSLGLPFLRAYYRSFARSPFAAAIVAVAEGAPVGVLVGTLDDGKHYHHVVRRQWWRLLPFAVVGLLRRPDAAWHFARTRLRRYVRGFVRLRRSAPAPLPSSTAEPSTSTPPSGPQGVLTHIAVDGSSRSHGVGAALMAAFVDEARRAGTARLRVVTLAGAEGAAAFYARTGWEPLSTFCDAEGQWWESFALVL